MRKPRKADDSFPYTDARVTFFCWLNGELKYACTVEHKIEMCQAIRRHADGQRPALRAVWPGQTRTDLFILDVSTAMAKLRGE